MLNEILQITPKTGLTLTLVQFGSAIIGVGVIWYAWFTNNQRHKDHEREILDLKTLINMREQLFEKSFEKFEKLQNDKIEEINSQFEQKFIKLEEASKHFYKQLDAKTDKLDNQVNELLKLMQTMTTDLKVHLAQCDVKHTKK